MSKIVENIVNLNKTITGIKPQAVSTRNDVTRLIVKIITRLPDLPSGLVAYQGKIVDPNTGVESSVIEPIITLNEYKYFADDLAIVEFVSGMLPVAVSGGTFETGEQGYGYYFAE